MDIIIVKYPINDKKSGQLSIDGKMLQKNDIEILRKLFSQHNHIMTTAELTASKLYYADIKLLLDEGLIERVRRGYYYWVVMADKANSLVGLFSNHQQFFSNAYMPVLYPLWE